MFHMWADELIEAVEMQNLRLIRPELPDGYVQMDDAEQDEATELISFRTEIDLDFYFLSLRRLLRIAEVAGAEGYGSQSLRDAIRNFKRSVPGLVEIRDSFEHADDWIRQGRGKWSALGIGGIGGDVTFQYGPEHKVTVRKATEAAHQLFEAIKQNVPALAPNQVVEPLKPGEADRGHT